jgi:1,4-dihydroxy-2-naphthoate octaprenyltransferase
LHISGALGVHIAAFLWINEFPDFRADKAHGKRNLVVRLGLQRAAFAYIILLATAYSWLALAVINHPGSSGYLWGLVGAPLAAFSAWRLLHNTNNVPRLVGAQAACLGGFVLMAFAAGLGYWLT